MRLKDIIAQDAEGSCLLRPFSILAPNAQIYGALRLPDLNDLPSLRPDILYVVTMDRLPAKTQGGDTYDFLILLQEEEELDPRKVSELRRTSNLLTTTASAPEVLAEMQQIVFADPRIETMMRQLTEAGFSGDLERLMEIGAEDLDCAMVLTDQFDRLREKTGREHLPGGHAELVALYESPDIAAAVKGLVQGKKPVVGESEHEFRDIQVYELPEMEAEIVLTSIRVHGIHVGQITAIRRLHTFGVFEAEMTHRMALVAAEVMQAPAGPTSQNRLQTTEFLRMLTEDEYPSPPAIRKAEELIGFSFKGACQYACIRVIPDDEQTASDVEMLQVIAPQIEWALPDILWAILDDRLVILFNMEKECASTPEETRHFFRGLVEKNNLSLGFSKCYSDLIGSKLLFWQARQASTLGWRILHQKVTEFDEIGYYSMLSIVQKKMDLMTYVDPKLMKLLQDEKNGSQEQLQTLYYYLKFGGNTGKVGAKLFLHRNTVLYRMDKIIAATGIDLNDGTEIMHLMFSFEILRYLGLLNFA